MKHWVLLSRRPREKGKRLQALRGITYIGNQVPILSLCGGKNFQLQEHLWGPGGSGCIAPFVRSFPATATATTDG